ncbi:MAG: phytanoyl-CoA dioxygenase family protein [Gammaproteobacteria bacterium]
MSVLSEQEIATYERDGLVIPADFRLSRERRDALHARVASVVVANPEIESDRLINVHLHGGAPFGVQGDDAFFDLAREPAILDMVSQLIGPDLILWSTHLFCKPAARGREVPWHQDGHYWPIRPLATCTVWVALDDVSVDNGALRYLPGSHRKGDYRHHADDRPDVTLNQAIDEDQFDEAHARYVELEAGQMSLHDVHLVHGSAANTSGRRRAGLAMRYMPSTSQLRRDLQREVSMLDWTEMPIFLVRGENRHAGNDLSVGLAAEA